MTRTYTSYEQWIGTDVYDSTGEKIGEISEVFYDQASNRPEWLAVKTGLFGMKTSFVPIMGSSTGPEGNLRVAYTKDQVKDSPRIDPMGALNPDEERELWKHFGYNWDESQGHFGYGTTYTSGQRADRDFQIPSTGTHKRKTDEVRLRRYDVTEVDRTK
jgi:sporulation protein YlmC with PRC-barrel domain